MVDTAPEPRPDAVLVACSGVEKSFGEGNAKVRVLRGASFDAHAGEMTYLVGPSGCGKTTLISVIGAILSADDGEVSVLGTDLRVLSRPKLADFRLRHFGFVFQQFNLLPALTAAENAAIPRVARGESTGDAEEHARQLLAELGLGDHADKMPAQLSGGQQQRVAIARALVHEPSVLICDEPTASLDAASGSNVMALLSDLAVEGDRSVIIVTHDDRIFDHADVIHHMADGEIEEVEDRREQAGRRREERNGGRPADRREEAPETDAVRGSCAGNDQNR
ncbi:ABC transporter ATP-binding protein [Phycisphaera mikurensis]|uniref:Putative ABC transporter ATP-binding protein n=1 Tax=Phycisphaera mikurensis (strain NBRC 102666 / KCTC 22515 / FYK2301M01) TaxID=1142394 RepID=I0IIM2_PHYMF|nr:ABC transporter ATP-binding protein [Phycisphaera mikurensis]MBB6442738.1 putative ABC transport system ATP-binding protein [Phycisphaera mikurensis]BAM05110.1 putative ABC transporter ATP-binding protein [Phycisphaera mikurensis NBRC 102666]